jgi:hypothetical protein
MSLTSAQEFWNPSWEEGELLFNGMMCVEMSEESVRVNQQVIELGSVVLIRCHCSAFGVDMIEGMSKVIVIQFHPIMQLIPRIRGKSKWHGGRSSSGGGARRRFDN